MTIKKILSVLICLVMVLSLMPMAALADDYICEHEQAHLAGNHTTDCGYSAGSDEVPCNHSHTDECKKYTTNCVHDCEEAGCEFVPEVPGVACIHQHGPGRCSYQEAREGVPCDCGTTTQEHSTTCSYVEEQAAVPCNHITHNEHCKYKEAVPAHYNCTHEGNCTEASGCVSVSYENCTHTTHDTACGWKEAVPASPCTFECTVCSAPNTTTLTPLTITVKDQTVTYGAYINENDYTHSGVKPGHSTQIKLKLVGNKIEVESAKVIDGSNNDVTDQYSVTYVPGTLTVNKATVYVAAQNASKELGAADPAFTYEVAGLVAPDTAADVLTGALQRAPGDNKGTYAINQGTLAIADAYKDKYQLSFTPGKFTIGGAPLTITTNQQTITYGESIKQGEYSASALASGHTLTVVLTPSTTNAGTGTIKVSSAVVTDGTGKDVTADYAVSINEGTLTINPKPVTTPTITLDRASYGYTGKAITPTVTAVYDGSTFIPASEYTVSYENNVNLGTGTGIVRLVDKAGGNYAVSGYTTFSIINNVQYRVILGNGGCWYRGSYYGLGFRCDGPYSDFIGISIDGRHVDQSYYQKSEGSTNVGLYPQLLNMLGNGTHYITFHYTSGSATGVFYVGSTAINAVMTGDDNNMGLLALVMCLGVLSSVTILSVLRKKKSGV